MSKIIPNENTWIGFSETAPVDLAAPTEGELDLAITMTHLIVSLNASAAGNAIPTPALDSLFDRSITGTSQGQFTGDFYRDDDSAKDIAWSQLPRAKEGYFFVSRFGGSRTVTAADALGNTAERRHVPADGEPIEVWPIRVTSRVGSALTSNTAQTFNLTAAVPEPPEEDAVVGGAAGITVVRNLTITSPAAGVALLDFDAPTEGTLTTPFYDIFQGATAAAAQAELVPVSANLQISGTTARITGLTTGTYWFAVEGHGATNGPRCASKSVTVA